MQYTSYIILLQLLAMCKVSDSQPDYFYINMFLEMGTDLQVLQVHY